MNRPKSLIPSTPSAEEFYSISRYKVFLLGRKNPWWLTRLTFYFGLITFLYFCTWNLLKFLAVSLVDSQGIYPHPERIKEIFYEIGLKYKLMDPIFDIKLMSLTNLVASAFIFLGLLIIWRRKKIGYYFSFIGLIVCMATPLIFMGILYVKAEVKWFEYSFALGFMALLIVDFYLRPLPGK